MQRRLISGHSPMEPVVGYSRAVVVGPHVYVAGTAPIPRDGGDPPTDVYGQTRLCLEIISGALSEAGASLEDVVRTRLYLVAADDFEEAGRAHGEAFASVRPANTTVVVAALVDPRWRVELEVEAVVSLAGR